MAARPKKVDWDDVGVLYRAGILPNSVIGKKYGISHTAVQKRAKAEGWTRDLSKRIEAEREAKVSRSMVSSKVAAQRAATDSQVVEANATMQTNIILEHRRDISELRITVTGLSTELAAMGNKDLRVALELVLDEKCDSGSDKYKAALTKAFDAALSMGGRSSAVRNLTASIATLIDKERQAFGIDKNEFGKKPFPEWLDGI